MGKTLWVGALTASKDARCGVCGKPAALGHGHAERFPFSSVLLWRLDWLCLAHSEEAMKRAQELRKEQS